MTTEDQPETGPVREYTASDPVPPYIQQHRDESLRKVTEGPGAHHFQEAAQTLRSTLSPEAKAEEEAKCGVHRLAVQLLTNLEDFRTNDPYVMGVMLSTQASLLNSLFNRALENAGLDNKESFSVPRANVALQAQRQCKTLLEFMRKTYF